MRAGKLRHLIQLCSPIDSATAKGDNEVTFDYVNYIEVYANIEPLVGRELQFAQQIRADLSHKITMRYHNIPDHRTQIRWWDGFKYRIFWCGPAVDTELRNVELSIYAQEII